MLFRKDNSIKPSFYTPIAPAVVLGTGACILFYGLIFAGPLDFALLRRYCLCHPVAIATTGLFLVACVALAFKWVSARQQQRLNNQAASALDEIAINQSDLKESASGEKKSQWFNTLWQTQGNAVCECWLGQRVSAILQRQLKRKNTSHLDDDLHELADRDADRQHDSYGLIRIVTWAMPMLGFLGTVLGISDTLGQMDAQALASGSQDAMNSLTAGLYVAFDTTAIGLVLTMVAMFIQFGINRTELVVLNQIDARVSEAMHFCLTEQEKGNDTSNIEATLQHITTELLHSVQQIVEKQSELWQQTIGAAHGHWQNLTSTSAGTLQTALTHAIESAISKHDQSLSNHNEQIARIQAEGAVMIDSRWQQWQTTLSEQARSVHQQQRDMAQQTELLHELIEKHEAVRDMEPPLEAMLQRLTNVDRFHDAAICLTEAVAVLGTQMERHGYLGRQPVRQKSAMDDTAVLTDATATDDLGRETLPLKRRAG